MRRTLTSSSILSAATELSSLKSISDEASVRRKLPSAEKKRQTDLLVFVFFFFGPLWFRLNWKCEDLTLNVALEELWEDAIWGQLVEHAAEELLCDTCDIPWDQHAAKHKDKDCVLAT